jgi:cation diffusion facilitator CzcD-associated flavoprotein CzcO
VKVAIVGAGFSGIAMAIALKRGGVADFEIFERADGLGGVWHHNTYPGATCDVPSYLYSYSFAQRRDWSAPCSPQPEILDYLHATASRYGVSDHVRTGCEIASATFDEQQARWILQSASGERFEAGALVLACGQLSRPAWPSIPGMEDFAGHSFHSAEWDHDYELRGKRVAVIGTGASAIQFVPPVAERAGHMDVYQRTAPYLLPRQNPAYKSWIKTLIARTPGAQRFRRAGMWLFMESFILALTRFTALAWVLRSWSTLFMRTQVRDPELRRKISPDYPFGCKRILFSSSYLPALQRPNVELITDRVQRITEHGVVSQDGQERPTDCIIYGTGFQANKFVTPMQVTGTKGQTLERAWAGGAEAHLGLTVAGFPGMFVLYGPNTNLGVGSIITMIEAQVGYAVDALRATRELGVAALEVRPEVQRASTTRVQERLRGSVWTACESWYRADSGRITNNWPGYMIEYVRATRKVKLDEYRPVRPQPRGAPEPANASS